ncbi:MAG: hypothetical protein KAG61_11680 [Bacteriovoracaceae bacterium]|nr:hypothetical protein [Bacteriovoracaceae bacterium]
MISQSNTSFRNGVHYLELDVLKLNDGAVVVIDQSMAGEKLNIIVKELIAVGTNLIIQPFTDQFRRPHDFSDLLHPKALDGKKGRDYHTTSPSFSTGHTLNGGDGESGHNGLSSSRITLDVGIKAVGNLMIVIKSESGGNGGNGGNGQNGILDSTKTERENTLRDGGSGGRGGDGGKPGNIHPFTFIWKPLSTLVRSNLNNIPVGVSIDLISGVSGTFGFGGRGGNGSNGYSWKDPFFGIVLQSLDGGSPGSIGDHGQIAGGKRTLSIGKSELIVKRKQ